MSGSLLIDSAALARRYGVTVDTVRTWFRRGWIPAYRAGRRPLLFDPQEVDKVLRERAQHPSAVTSPNASGTPAETHARESGHE